MSWLQRLKAIQETTADEIQNFSILPESDLSKLSKAVTYESTDIFMELPDFSNRPSVSKECLECTAEPIPSLATIWRFGPKTCLTDDELQAREQCRFWKQVCRAVGMYQNQCTGTCDSQCRIYRFLELNTR